MIKIYLWDEEFEYSELSKFMDFLNSCEPEDAIHIYLNSGGGAYSVLESLLCIINQEPERFTIFCSECAFSCAYLFLIYTKCKKILTANFTGMLHMAKFELQIRTTGKVTGAGFKFFTDKQIKSYEQREKYLLSQLKLPKKDEKTYWSGGDVYLDYKTALEHCALNLTYV